MLIKLFAISIVASKDLGASFNFRIAFACLDSSFSRRANSLCPKEKKATYEPETNAEPIINTINSAMYIIRSELSTF